MVSLRAGGRAVPVAWKVVATKGPIGFKAEEELLNRVLKMMPKEISILLLGDRFYGTSALVKWCQKAGWSYRLRLKSNLILEHEGGQLTTGEVYKMKLSSLEGAHFHNTDVPTNIGILHEEGHPEPWIIAMDCRPSAYTVLDYGMKWGIEAVFSDFKSRGFCITKTHLQHADRIERMILILTVALYWAVSTGMQPREKKKTTKKKPFDRSSLSSKEG